MKEKIIKLKLDICSKVMRSGYWADLELDLRLDEDDLKEDIDRLRQMQDLEYDQLLYGKIEVE
jgi:hypothetical protein